MNALKRRQILRYARPQLQRFKFLCGKGRKAKQEKAKKQKDKGDDAEDVESSRFTEEDSKLLPLFLTSDLDFPSYGQKKSDGESCQLLSVTVHPSKKMLWGKIVLAG